MHEIKKARPDLGVILGGEHVTAMPEFCLATAKADWLVLGEGEETIVDLIRAISAGDVTGIDGIAYRREGEIVVNPRRKRRKDVDAIAWPAWHLIDWKTYNDCRYVGGMDVGKITFPILATRGCPYQCTFCSSANMWTTNWIPRDPVKVVDEIQHYVETYGARNFPFQDLTAIIKRDWIVTFCKEIIKRDLKILWQFPSGTRSEAIDFEVAELLYRSGMINMGYAPESGSETTRKLIKKKMTEERLLKSVEQSIAAKLNVSLQFVIGFPHDNKENLKENFPFIDKIAASGVTDLVVGLYMALPGTEIFDSLYDAGKIRLNRSYFSHILQGSSIFPDISYCESLGRLALAFWKLRLSIRFYSAKQKRDSKGLLSSLWRGFRGIFKSDGHVSRLETAIRNGLYSAFVTLKVRFKPRWMPLSQEISLMKDWDDIYKQIRRQNMVSGILPAMPADTTRLHETNVNARILKNHSSTHRVAVPASVGSG